MQCAMAMRNENRGMPKRAMQCMCDKLKDHQSVLGEQIQSKKQRTTGMDMEHNIGKWGGCNSALTQRK